MCSGCNLRSKLHTVSLVTQSCPTLCKPTDWSPPASSVHGISQARILEWVAISFSRGIFPTRGLNLCLLCLLHYKQILLSAEPSGSHWEPTNEGPRMWGWLLGFCLIFPILTSVRRPKRSKMKWNQRYWGQRNGGSGFLGWSQNTSSGLGLHSCKGSSPSAHSSTPAGLYWDVILTCHNPAQKPPGLGLTWCVYMKHLWALVSAIFQFLKI